MNTARIGWQLARSLVEALADDCGVAASLARVAAGRGDTAIGITTFAQGAPMGAAARAAEDFVRRGWLRPDPAGWRTPPPNTLPMGLADFLEGAAAMRAAFPAESRATAVVTMPPMPSAVGRTLAATEVSHAALVPTREAFERVADAASVSLTVMTPFMNNDGLTWALDLFGRTRATRRRLIVRSAHGSALCIRARADEIRECGVEVLVYLLPSPIDAGYETFHAKVVLADSSMAYVGSANMLAYARHSMELGVLADGRAARVLASVVRAVEAVARPLAS